MSNILSAVTKRKHLSLNVSKFKKESGQVSEWFKEVVLKTTDAARYPGVRIPPCPFLYPEKSLRDFPFSFTTLKILLLAISFAHLFDLHFITTFRFSYTEKSPLESLLKKEINLTSWVLVTVIFLAGVDLLTHQVRLLFC